MQEPLPYDEWVRAGRPGPDDAQQAPGPLSYDEWKRAGRPVPGLVGDVARSAVQGATFGFSDELRGIGAALVPGGRGYTEARDAERESLAQMPMGRRVGGELLGAVVTAPLAAGKLLQAPKLARLGGVGRTAAVGAVEGAAYGAGTADGDLADRVTGAATGAAYGAGGGAALAGAGKVAGGVARGAGRMGGKVAGKVLGNSSYGGLIGEGLAQTVLPGPTAGMAGYIRRAIGRRMGKGAHQRAIDAYGAAEGGVGARAAAAWRAARSQAPEAATGPVQAAAPTTPPPTTAAHPLTMNPARQITARSSVVPPPGTSPQVLGRIGRPTPPQPEIGPGSAFRGDEARARRMEELFGGRTAIPATPLTANPARQIPAKSSAAIVTPPPRTPRPEPNPQIQAYLASNAARRGRIGPEVPESLVVPRETSPGAVRQAQGTQFAQRARDEKVNKLVGVIRGNAPEGVTANQLADFLEQQPRETLSEYVQQAGVNQPSEKTWEQVFGALRRGDDPVAALRAEGVTDEAITRGLRQSVADEPLVDQLRKSVELNQRLGRGGAAPTATKPAIERVDIRSVAQDPDGEYLYHVTSAPRADLIGMSGFQQAAPVAGRGGGYEANSAGRTFFTDKKGVNEWRRRIEAHLFDQFDDPPETVVIRVRKDAVPDLQPDDIQDVPGSTSYFAPTSPLGRLLRDESGSVTPLGDEALDISPQATLRRAREQGFDVDAYHGTGSDFPAFDNAHLGRATGNVTTPLGHHFAPDADEASRMAQTFGGNAPSVLPAKLKLQNPLEMSYTDFEKIKMRVVNGMDEGDAMEASRQLRQELMDAGYDGIVVRTMRGKPTEYVVFRPENIRSRFAKFDPKNIGKADLLGGALPGAVNAISRTGIGAGVGAAYDEENPLRGAAYGAIGGLAAGPAIKNLRGMNRIGAIGARPPLRATHNTTAEGLKFADEMGGIPNPSLAIHQDAHPFTSMGEASLVGRTDIVDPAKGARVFDADIYSARTPSRQYRFTKDAEKLARELEQANKDIGESYYSRAAEDLLEGKESALDNMTRDSGAKALFLREQGIDMQPVMRAPKLEFPFTDALSLEDASALYNSRPGSPEWAAVSARVRDLVDVLPTETQREAYATRLFDEATGQLKFGPGDRIARDINKLHRGEVVDIPSTDAALDRALKDGGLEDAFREWVNGRVAAVRGDAYFERGRRKVPFTLDNLSDEMKRLSDPRSQEGRMTYGPGEARAAGAREFGSLDEIRAAGPSLVDKEALEAAKAIQKQTNDKMGIEEILAAKGTDGEGLDTWDALNDLHRVIADMGKGRSMQQALRRNGFAREPEGLKEYAKTILEAPTTYFEVKTQRPVRLEEFAGVVLPDDAPADVVAAMRSRGLRVETYKLRDDASRQEAMRRFNDAPGVLFSIGAGLAFGIPQQNDNR